MMRTYLSVLFALRLLTACGGEEVLPEGWGAAKGDTSGSAVMLDFTFDGALISDPVFSAERMILSQILFSVGQLNSERFGGVGQLNRVVLTNVEVQDSGDGRFFISYRATMPVAWDRRNGIPSTYTLWLPYDNTDQGIELFARRYKDCTDCWAASLDPRAMFYYYIPQGCEFQDEDVYAAVARVSPSASQTSGKYPEYQKVWKDGVLEVIAVFGKYAVGGSWDSDKGISSFNEFCSEVSTMAGLSHVPDPQRMEFEYSFQLAEGKHVHIVAMLVDNVSTADESFRRRYGQLSRRADLIAYSGHSGLGKNIRALSRWGRWEAGQYVIVYMNGCDTFAYLDSSLMSAHTSANNDDPLGTKYIDFILNAMPSKPTSGGKTTMVLVRALMAYNEPVDYEHILAEMDNVSEHLAVATGEEDNVFAPGLFPL